MRSVRELRHERHLERRARRGVGSHGRKGRCVGDRALRDVRAVRIDPKVVDPDDVETLQDLVVGALQDAARAAQQLQQEKMGPLAGGLGGDGGLGLPGF